MKQPELWISLAVATLCSNGAVAGGLEQLGAVRFGGGHTDAGRVEVQYKGAWGWINLGPGGDPQNWNRHVADVICRQLGLRQSVGTMLMVSGAASDVSPVAGAQCNGTERRLAECALVLAGNAAAREPCPEGASSFCGAGVRCTNFMKEEQPRVVVTGRSGAELMANASFALSCETEPVGAGPLAPDMVFACGIHLPGIDASDSEGLPIELQVPRNGGIMPKAVDPFVLPETVNAFVFGRAMIPSLAFASRRFAGVLLDTQSKKHRAFAAASTALGVQALEIGLTFGRVRVGYEQDCNASGRRSEGCAAGAPAMGKGVLRPNLEGLGSGLAAIRQAYFSPLARLIFDLDAVVTGLAGRKPAGVVGKGLEASAAKVHRLLEDEGLAELGDLQLPPAVRRLAKQALADAGDSSNIVASSAPLPALERWLFENRTVQSAVAAYLGGHAMLHGYRATHLPAEFTTEDFVSAHWHHDRAGRRLKLFIRLDDVDAGEGHPTRVALRSHKTSYYWHEEYEQSRYADSYVRAHFDVATLSGKAGTGYIFDTNAIHRGTPEGSRSRDVIVVEYHQAAKCGLIAQLGLNIPCPSGDQQPLNWYFSHEPGASEPGANHPATTERTEL